MNWKKIAYYAAAIILVLIIIFFIFKSVNKETFNVDAVVLKSVIKTGETTGNSIKISSLKEQEIAISSKIDGLDVSFSESNFLLKKGEEKSIEVSFKEKQASSGVYTGKIVISSTYEEKEIPVILEVQSKKMLYAINLQTAPEYREIKKGTSFSTNIKIFNLIDTKKHSIKLNYLIRNFNGNTIFDEKDSIVIGSDITTTKTFSLPEKTNTGDYAFIVIAESDNSTSTSSYMFSIIQGRIFQTDLNWNIILPVFIIILLLGIMALVVFVIRDRNKLFEELAKQHDDELKELEKKIEEQKKFYLKHAKTTVEKKVIVKRFRKIKKTAVKKIKTKHREQKKEFARLRKQKKKSEMQKKLEEWKKQGYEISELMGEKITKKEKLKKWKKQGYRI
jgi:hypothetical protein